MLAEPPRSLYAGLSARVRVDVLGVGSELLGLQVLLESRCDHK